MIDDAEAWLQEHDPDYATSSRAWRESSQAERREVPVGGGAELDWLLSHGKAREMVAAETRACELCGHAFVPTKSTQRFCSEQHRKSAENRRGYRRRVRGIRGK